MTVERTAVFGDHSTLKFVIRDTGIGIDESSMPKIFDAFTQEDGVEVAKEIRERYDNETTVIILTAFNWDEIMDDAIHIGVDSFLAKPLFASNVIDEFERAARKNSMSIYKDKARADLKGRHVLMAEDVQRSLQAGMNAHLSKPVDPEHLYQTLEELIGERSWLHAKMHRKDPWFTCFFRLKEYSCVRL